MEILRYSKAGQGKRMCILLGNIILDTKCKKISLKNLRVEDFCYSLVSTNIQHLGSLLYVFAPQVDLFNIDSDVENVSIYIKIEICETSTGRRTVAVSFHEIERPIEYAFR